LQLAFYIGHVLGLRSLLDEEAGWRSKARQLASIEMGGLPWLTKREQPRYTTFGVIRGRIGFNFAQELSGHTDTAGGSIRSSREIVELDDVSVEHYSNHLPTASFERLYIRLVDVQAFALLKT
jgi:hypothetical protein